MPVILIKEMRLIMDKFLRQLIYSEFKIGKTKFTFLDILFVIVATILGCLMRFSLKSIVTGDYSYFLEPWINEFKEGGYRAISGDFYNYNPPYMVILWFISILPINMLSAVKLVSCLFDFIIALFIALSVLELTNSKSRTMFAYAAAWFFPIIIANSALWAQCDAIYSSFLLMSFYFILKDKPLKSTCFWGIAFGFKMQALFWAPVYILLWAKRKYKLKHFLAVPIMYILSLMPAVLAGKSFSSALHIYSGQAGYQNLLGYCWPGVYELIGNYPYYDYYGPAAMWWTLGILMCVMFYLAYKNYSFGKLQILDVFLFLSMVTVYFLPYMHERYGYPMGLLTIIFGLTHIKKLYFPIIYGIVTYASYTSALVEETTLPLWLYSFLFLGLIIDLGIYIFKYVNSPGLEEVKNGR